MKFGDTKIPRSLKLCIYQTNIFLLPLGSSEWKQIDRTNVNSSKETISNRIVFCFNSFLGMPRSTNLVLYSSASPFSNIKFSKNLSLSGHRNHVGRETIAGGILYTWDSK